MKLVDAATWAAEHFHPNSKPDLRTVRGWVRDGYLAGEIRGGKVLVDAARFEEETSSTWPKRLLKAARSRANRRNLSLTLTVAEVAKLVQRSKNRCEVTGLPFDFSQGDSYHRPWVPSLDRIDSSKGYHFDNCRIVCAAVNVAMGAWGLDVFRQVARALIEREEEQ